jgi:hypothetical protein
MGKRVGLLVLCSMLILAVSISLLYGYCFATGHTLTLKIGSSKVVPEFVQINWPMNVDVLYQIEDSIESKEDADIVVGGVPFRGGKKYYRYDGTAVFTFHNDFDKDVKIHLPLLRASWWFPGSTQFYFTNDLKPEWKQEKTITLKPDETYTLSHRFVLGMQKKKVDGMEDGRWALVFGVPDGEDPDEYLVGTVLTNLIRWERKDRR